jgi:hypothetical protein
MSPRIFKAAALACKSAMWACFGIQSDQENYQNRLPRKTLDDPERDSGHQRSISRQMNEAALYYQTRRSRHSWHE